MSIDGKAALAEIVELHERDEGWRMAFVAVGRVRAIAAYVEGLEAREKALQDQMAGGSSRMKWRMHLLLDGDSASELRGILNSMSARLAGEWPSIRSDGTGNAIGGGGGAAYRVSVDPQYTRERYMEEIDAMFAKDTSQ